MHLSHWCRKPTQTKFKIENVKKTSNEIRYVVISQYSSVLRYKQSPMLSQRFLLRGHREFHMKMCNEKWIKTHIHKKCNNITNPESNTTMLPSILETSEMVGEVAGLGFKIIWKWIERVFPPSLSLFFVCCLFSYFAFIIIFFSLYYCIFFALFVRLYSRCFYRCFVFSSSSSSSF